MELDIGVENIDGKPQVFVRPDNTVTVFNKDEIHRDRTLSIKELLELFPNGTVDVTEVQNRKEATVTYTLNICELEHNNIPYDNMNRTIFKDTEAEDIGKAIISLIKQYDIKDKK